MIRALHILALSGLAFLILAEPASAGPAVGAVFAAIGTAFKAIAAIEGIGAMLLRMALSTGLSLLMKKKQQRKQRQSGLQTTHTTTGGTDPQASVVGRYATAGHLVYHNSYEANRVKLAHVIEVGDIPGATLRGLIIDGEYSEIGTIWHDGHGYEILSKNVNGGGYAWIRFFDGSQTQADPRLVELFSGDAERPWTNDHLMSGLCYAVLTYHRNDKVYPQGRPQVRLVLDGPGFYDPRQDSTAGGNGSQRWDTPATWAQTDNQMVIAYNILRGITLPCGSIYGGAVAAEDLPYADWAAAMDACDLLVGPDNRVQFRCGYEIKFEEAPADVLEELFASANAEVVEIGGYWYPLVGAPTAAVAEIGEEDPLVSESWKHDPFPGVESTFNAVTISHPSPGALWNSAVPETIIKDDWISEDGGQKLFDLRLPMVWDAAQARQLGNALLQENRRFITHRWPLPPQFFFLRPLQAVTATNAEYGYVAKSFRITEAAYDLLKLTVSVSLRESDPSDFAPDDTLELPEATPVTGPIIPEDAGVPGFAVYASALKDNAGNDRAPAIRLVWDASLADSVEALSFRIKAVGTTELATASVSDVAAGELIFDPVLPDTDYLVQAKPIARRRATDWTVWLPVTTSNIRIGPIDLSSDITDTLGDAGALLAGYTGGNLEQTLADMRADNEAAIAPLGGSVLRQPASQWTLNSPSERPNLTKPPVSGTGAWITDDSEFGECFAFTASDNKTIGPAFPVAFVPGRVYKFTASFKVTYDGTDDAGCRVLLGCTTQIGTTLDAGNKQNAANTPHPKISDGIVEHTAYASSDMAALAAYGITDPAALIDLSAASPDANKAYFHLRQNAGGATSGRLRVASLYVTDVTEALRGVNLARSELQSEIDGQSASIATLSAAVVDLEGNAAATYSLRALAGTSGAELELIATSSPEGAASLARLSADNILLEGSVLVEHLSADVLSANNITAGTMSVARIEVDELLSIDAKAAGFSMDKITPFHDVDGLYMGRTVVPGGATGFGFAMSRYNTVSGLSESISGTSQYGLQIKNAQFYRDLAPQPTAYTSTTSETVNLAASVKTVQLSLIGGGGGGAGRTNSTGVAGNAGGTTTVKLYDGSNTLHGTWTAAGGSAGLGWGSPTTNGQPGAASTWGSGGSGGLPRRSVYECSGTGKEQTCGYTILPATSGTQASGKGAGGGGGGGDSTSGIQGGGGGGASAVTEITGIDVSALSSPRLEITIGSGGTGAVGGTSSGGYGTAGQVNYTLSDEAQPYRADVIPLEPQAVGTLQTHGPFPDLGAGFWTLSSFNSTYVSIYRLEVNDSGQEISSPEVGYMSFHSSKTPVVTNTSYPNRTVYYQFFKMGDE